MLAEEIAAKIHAPQPLLTCLSKRLAPESLLRALTDIDTAPDAYKQLREVLREDRNGYQMFACMMQAATLTWEKYRELGIDEGVFIDTLSCFTRFAEEFCASYGEYGFDRGWWTYRQLSCVLFRIGTLEYEYRDDEKTVHLHIPSGADIALGSCKKSLDAFHVFTEEHFPGKNYPITCGSWLLSPALDEMLPPDAKIIRFKNCFEIEAWNRSEKGCLQWVYGRSDIAYPDLPENTTLQREMKKYLLRGGEVGSARGRLKDFG